MTSNPTTPTCLADDEGRPCQREADATHPVPLCRAHRIEVAMTVLPEVMRNALAAAVRGTATAAPAPADLIATARAAKLDELLHGVHDSVVYFIANGGRVKIGYTTNLRSRLGSLALRSDSVLLALRGGPELERALHAHFAAHRNGNTEWFELSPAIFRFVASRHTAATPAAPARNSRPAAEPSASSEREIEALVGLMQQRGSAQAVGLPDARRIVASAAKATAARRLKAARARFNAATA